ncbi:DUF1080 domain-containing protein [Botrimarina sp.]|uniref:3-keto-disaccharide hydrolase n=1 Tax=Botrimarina sp. TaxID=2795802 RepID=UPI0032F024A7
MFRTLCVLLTFASPSFASDDFRPLFDGESLDGWTQRGGEAHYTVAPEAPGGAQIVGTSVANTPNSFLCTDRDYADFVLEFEVKVDPTLNSGVQFRSECYDKPTTKEVKGSNGEVSERKFPAGRVHGYQAEIDPSDRSWSAGVYDEGRRGWLFTLDGDEHADARAAFDRRGWNHYRIEAVGPQITTHINGVKAADFTDSQTAEGFIALQVHSIGSKSQEGAQVRWRNIRIKEVQAE